jgi:hypothetical protein
VSFVEIPDGRLYPRIPSLTGPFENKTIPRICFSRTIEGAITAMPQGAKALKTILKLQRQNKLIAVLHLYTIEESNLPQKNIWLPNRVQRYVVDANYTGETWILNQEVFCDHKTILISNAEIIEGIDIYGEKMAEVVSLEWANINLITKKYSKKTPEWLMVKCNIDIQTLREALAAWDNIA